MLAALLVGSIVAYVLERRATWANDWLPNFIAEWSGILLALLVFDRLKEAQQRREFEMFLRPLRKKAGLALGKAVQPMIDFLLVLAESTGFETKPGYDLVPFMDELWHWLIEPREGIVDPRTCLADWVKTIAEVESRLRVLHINYDTILDPEALAEVDDLADRLGDRQWLVGDVGKPIGPEVANLITPHLYQSIAPLETLSLYFEAMVGAPLTTGPWHVPPEEHTSWQTMPEVWQRIREDARRRVGWTFYVEPIAVDVVAPQQ